MARKPKASPSAGDAARNIVAKAARDALKPKRRKSRKRKLTTAQKAKRKEVRHKAAVLKRKGLLERDYNVRKATPNSRLRRLFAKFSGVLAGRETTYHLPDDKRLRAILRKEGYTIVGDRIVLSQESVYRKPGKKGGTGVRRRAPKGISTGRKPFTVKLDAQFETRVRATFDKLKPNEAMAFDVFGNSSFATYEVADALIADVTAYDARARGRLREIGLFAVRDPAAYRAEREAAKEATDAARRRRINERRRQARAGSRRVTRGK